MNIVQELKTQIVDLQFRLKRIQDECSHPVIALTKTHHSDTGNWCRSDDRYWTTFNCGLCEKTWNEEGSK